MNTDCTKCRAPMCVAPATDTFLGRGITTGYRCKGCDHWNDFKRRKGYEEWKAAQQRQEGK